MAISLSANHLEILGLKMADVQDLPADEQKTRIRNAWKKLCMLHHPDKGGSKERFMSINEAYQELTKPAIKEQSVAYNINQYFTQTTVTVPRTAFDMQIRDGISQAFERLRAEFLTLSDENKKRAFASDHASFLNLAQSIENNRSELDASSLEALNWQQKIEEFDDFLIRKWRELIIHLFAEEYLDDFQYRNALAFGELLPILATRKLLSPAKWVAAITGSINLLFNGAGEYLLKHQYQQLPSLLYLIGAPFGLINGITDLIACPVNNLIRPLSFYTGFSAPALTALFSIIGAGAIYLLAANYFTFSFTSALLLLPYLNIALSLYSAYKTIRLVQNINERGGDGTSLGLTLGIVILLNLIPSGDSLYDCIYVLSGYFFLSAIDEWVQDKPIDYLPLPTETVPEQIKEATLSGYKQANQSQRFFGTPKDADFQNMRSSSQKAASFFGYDSTAPLKPSEQWDNNSIPTQRLYVS